MSGAEERLGDRAVWLIEGDDPGLVSEATRSVIDELVGEADRSLVLEDFRGEEVDLGVVADACQTPPFLGDRRVVVLRDVGRWTTEEVGPLLAYLEDPLPTTTLVLAAGGGKAAAKLVAAVKKHGHVMGTTVSGKEAKSWLKQRLRDAPITLTGAAEARLEAHLGEDVSRLTGLVEVLVAAYGEKARIGPEELEPYLGEAGSVAPWDFTGAIDEGETEAALSLLHRMLSAGERHPLVVLAILHRHVQSVLRVSSPSITTEAQAADAMGIAKGRSTFPAKKALTTARRLGPDGAGQMIALVAEAEVALKGGLDWPGELVLEVLVARLCRLSRTTGGRGRRRAA